MHPGVPRWTAVVECFLNFCELRCTAALLTSFVFGCVKSCPVEESEVRVRKAAVISVLADSGLELRFDEGDCEDVPINFRFLDLVLRAADDPEVGLGQFALGVRVSPGARMPRLPPLYRAKKR